MGIERCVVYDVEIAKRVEDVPGKWDNPGGMGFASAVAYDYARDQYHFFLHEEQKGTLLALLQGRVAVTFNGVKFDSRVILGNDREVKSDKFRNLTHIRQSQEVAPGALQNYWLDYDILLKYIQGRFNYKDVAEAEGRLGDRAIHDGSFSLDGLGEGTLNHRKTGHGAHAPILYQEKKYAELLSYNLQDVRLTKKLFDFILQYNFVVDRSGRMVRTPKVNL